MTPAKRVLVLAKGMLENDGWCQGTNRNQYGERCAWGALDAAAYELSIEIGMNQDYVEPRAQAAQALQESLPIMHRFEPIPFFNDAETTTRGDVLAAFDRAIAVTR